MKKVVIVALVLLGAVSSNSYAQRFFIGGEIGAAIYPDFAQTVAQSVVNTGFASASVEQERSGLAAGIYGGAWITDNIGIEAAYTDLGSITGDVTTVPASTTTYKYAASAVSIAGLGAIEVGKGKLYAKLGWHKTSVDFTSVTRSINTSSSGLLIGGGYTVPLAPNLSAKMELAVYNGVKFQTFNAPAGTTSSDAITKVSVGLAFTF